MRVHRAVFLDKDGTLIRDNPYRAWKPVILPGVVEGIDLLRRRGFILVVVTNQSGIAKGLTTEAELEAQRIELVNALGPLAWYYCPHANGCECRKPKPGLLIRAADDLDIDLHYSWMVGDKQTDMEAGYAAGCRKTLVRAGQFLHAARDIGSDRIAPPQH